MSFPFKINSESLIRQKNHMQNNQVNNPKIKSCTQSPSADHEVCKIE